MLLEFLKTIQKRGWHILRARKDEVLVQCPARGCGLVNRIPVGGHVPEVDPQGERNRLDHPVHSFDDIREVLRARREDLGWSIRETEEVAGLSVDYLAKFEKDDPSKIPNAIVLVEWAQALGYEWVLRPAALPSLGLRMLADTRDRADARRRRFEHERERRRERSR